MHITSKHHLITWYIVYSVIPHKKKKDKKKPSVSANERQMSHPPKLVCEEESLK